MLRNYSNLRRLRIYKCNNCASIRFSIRRSSKFTPPENERFTSPIVPRWIWATLFNPLRPFLNDFHLWRYRKRYDGQFDSSAFVNSARQRFFQLANAVAVEDSTTLKNLTTSEAFDELEQTMLKNTEREKKTWRTFLKLAQSKHEMMKEKVFSVHFRDAPFRSANSESDQSIKRVLEIYTAFHCYQDDVRRKELIKIGYRGRVVDRADVYRPLVVSHLAFGKDLDRATSDWLITKIHFFVLFTPRRRRGYMSRVVRAKNLVESERGAKNGIS